MLTNSGICFSAKDRHPTLLLYNLHEDVNVRRELATHWELFDG